MKDLERRESELEARMAALEKQANNWTGGFMALAGLGGVITFLMAFWDRIKWN